MAEATEQPELNGFFGFGSVSKKILADTEGFFGWSASRATNLVISLVLPAGLYLARTPLQIKLSWAGGGLAIDYDPQFDLQRTVPTDTPITLTTSSPWYEPVTLTFPVAAGSVARVTVPLTFAVAYAFVTRHRYL